MATRQVELRGKVFEKERDLVKGMLADDTTDLGTILVKMKVLQTKFDAYKGILESTIQDYLDNDKEDEFMKVDTLLSEAEQSMEELVRYVKRCKAEAGETPKVNLPPLKLQTFTGEVLDWLPFWSSFSEVHSNVTISDSEKFQHLISCLPPNSKARKTIAGTPVCGQNYNDAIKALVDTYGNDNILIKVYVREIQKLVVRNARESSRMDFTDLVPDLVCQIKNLEQLGVTKEKCECILYPVVESCLPEDVLIAWQKDANNDDKLEPLINFLNQEVQHRMERSLAKLDFSDDWRDKHGHEKKRHDIATAAGLMAVKGGQQHKNDNCPFCDKKGHKASRCLQAKKLKLSERIDIVKKKSLCFVCLRHGHHSNECTSNPVCSSCQGRHYDILCKENARRSNMMMVPTFTPQYHMEQGHHFSQQQEPQHHPQLNMAYSNSWNHHTVPQQQAPPVQQQLGMNGQAQPPLGQVARSSAAANLQAGVRRVADFQNLNVGEMGVNLMTLPVFIQTPEGHSLVRVFLDGGSEESYIVSNVVEKMGIQPCGKQLMQHQVFGGGVTEPIRHDQYQVAVISVDGSHRKTFKLNAIERIAQCIKKPMIEASLKTLNSCGIPILDQRNCTEGIQILFGSDVCAQLWTGGFKRISPTLVAQETMFGWVFQGYETEPVKVTATHMCTSFLISTMSEEDLWSLELLGIQDVSRKETRKDLETAAVQHFEDTVTRLEDGRYEVHLPWIEGHKELLSNKPQALSRLYVVTRDLRAQGYLESYHQIMLDWLAMGIIEEDPENESSGMNYFMPHRHVIKEGSTTPVRPVFDASAKVKNSPSLNDCLEKGPNTLELIPAIMCRFRMKRIGIVADIKKAFLQLSVVEKDRAVLKFLWWKDTSCRQLVTYRHRRVVFGVKPSPFLLAAALQHHINHEGHKDHEHAKMLLHSFYVDNSVSSHDTMDEALQFKDKSVILMMEAQMDLRGWEVSFENDNSVPVLGMMWNTKDDTLSLYCERINKKMEGPLTKRGLLSVCNAVFDPLGFVSPITIVPKLLFQKCCKLQLKWYEPLPSEILTPFQKWKQQLHKLEEIKIPRWMCASEEEPVFSLEVFVDASGDAMAACVFMRSVSVSRASKTQLVMSRARVTPLKDKPTIPRLELIACLMGVRLATEVKSFLSMEEMTTRYYTDSSTALAWIVRDKPWDRWVQRRVNEIRCNSSAEEWFHISGELNPADLPSRGCTVEQLLQRQWWEGMTWMEKSEEEWNLSNVKYNEAEIQKEAKKTVVSAVAVEKPKGGMSILLEHSEYKKVLRITAFVYRYCQKLRNAVRKRKEGNNFKLTLKKVADEIDELEVEELDRAEDVIVRFIQEDFDGVADKKLRKLNCFVCEDNIIRLRSQLTFSSDDFVSRFHAILPSTNPLVNLIIQYEHELNCHGGTSVILALLRKKFWILNGRRTVGKVVFACLTCRRFNARKCVVPSVPLPSDRVKDTMAFDITGVDLFGPLYLDDGSKVWVVLYTCAVFRCIHLEVTDTLSTDGFLLTLRRFVSLCGRPSKIYSDNGTNFVGCNNLFVEINWDEVLWYANLRRIKWVFNPPTAAWWGGFWERMVRLTKNLLRRILGKKVVALLELQTLICEVAATLNQRPLTFLSDQDGELVPLCPNLFIRPLPVGILPEADVADSAGYRDVANKIQKLREELRGRFRKEYLAFLEQEMSSKYVTVGVGDVVLIEMEDRKRIDWPLGIVKSIYPGRDGRTRTALVRTSTGEFLRPVQRLYLLECMEKAVPQFQQETEEPSESETELECDTEVVSESVDVPEPVVDVVQPVIYKTRLGRKIIVPERFMKYQSFSKK